MWHARQSIAALLIGVIFAAAPHVASAQTTPSPRPAAEATSAPAGDGSSSSDGSSAKAKTFATMAATRAKEIITELDERVRRSYRQHPALMVGVLAALLLPLLAFAGYFVYRRRPEDQRRSLSDGDVIMPAAAAWIEVDGERRVEMHENRDFLQIGRQEDNDVCIADTTVHRYHAVIERSARQGFVIVDVSGPDGNGVVVNGERCARAELADGDTVEVGRALLRFQIAA